MMDDSLQSLIYGLIVIFVVVGFCALRAYIKTKLKRFSEKDNSKSAKRKADK